MDEALALRLIDTRSRPGALTKARGRDIFDTCQIDRAMI